MTAALALYFPTALLAQEKDGLPDFSSLSLQELSQIKVTSVARKQQKLSQAAAAVYVISREEIRRSGMATIADILRLAPGLSVARIDANKWAVSSRGFNGRFANKLLVFIDGHSVYNPIFSGVFWDMGMPALEDIERIEVIRGPGAAVWGANAVAGVINIITASARETEGVEINAGAGTTERAAGSFRYGGKLGDGAWYRGYVNAADHGDLRAIDGRKAGDGWGSEQTGIRIDGSTRGGGWQLEGDFFRSSRGDLTAVPTPENFFSSKTRYANEASTSADLMFEWRRQFSETSEVRVSSSYLYQNRPEIQFSKGLAKTGDVEAQYRFSPVTHHDVSFGLADREISIDVQGSGQFSFNPPQLDYQTVSGFAQDEIHFYRDRLMLTAGVKLQHDILSHWQAQPTGRVVWAPNTRHSFWIAVSRAVRTPTFIERTANLEMGGAPPSAQTFGLPVIESATGSPRYHSEVLKDYETGYRVQVSPRLSIDASGFYDRYDNLQTATPQNPRIVMQPLPFLLVPFALTNYARAHAEGAELAGTYHPFERLKLSASYSYLNVRVGMKSNAPEGTRNGTSNASPSHQWKLQSYLNVTKKVQLDCLMFYANGYEAMTYIPQHTRTDLRLGWKASRNLELSLVGQDVFSHSHLEITVGDAFSPPSAVIRGVYLKTTWRY